MSALRLYQALNLAQDRQTVLIEAVRRVVADSQYSHEVAAVLVDEDQFKDLKLALQLFEEKPLTAQTVTGES